MTILAPTNRRIIRPGDKPSFEHTQRYGLVKGHWANRGRVCLLPFNEGSGVQVLDLSGSGIEGIFYNGTVWSSDKYGPAPSVDGTDDFIYCGRQTSLEFSDNFTIVISLNPSNVSQYDCFFVNCASNGHGWRLWTRDAANYKWYWECFDGVNKNTISTDDIALNTTTHIVGTHDGTTLRLYVDGKLTGTPTAAGSITDYASNGTFAAVMMGDMPDIGGWPNVRGRCPAVKYNYALAYNRVLSASEIALLCREPFLGIEKRTAPVYFFVPTGAQDYIRTINDGIGVTDTGMITDCIVTLSHALGITDATVKAETRLLTESLGITDVASPGQGHVRTLAESLGITDAAVRVLVIVRTFAEALGITDAITDAKTFERTESEVLGITDASAPLLAIQRVFADALGVTDAVTKTETKERIVAETLGIIDAVTRTQAQLRIIVETLGLTDVMQPGQIIIFSDTVGLADAATRTQTQIRILAEALGMTDVASKVVEQVLEFAEILGITDDVARVMNYVTTQSDDVGIADAVVRVAVALRTIDDSLGVTDARDVSHVVGGMVKVAWAFMIIRQTHN